ncbi:hypothetical protein RKD55_004652 [Rossellomorea marisflavi]
MSNRNWFIAEVLLCLFHFSRLIGKLLEGEAGYMINVANILFLTFLAHRDYHRWKSE